MSLIKKIKIEIRRRLGACQFYIYFDSFKISANSEKQIQVSVMPNKLQINSEEIFTGVNLLPESLCGLNCVDNVLTFRIRLNQNLNYKDNTYSAFSLLDYEPAAQFRVGNSFTLQCLQCNTEILRTSITVGRITSEFTKSVDIADIFCHRNKKALTFEDVSSELNSTDSQSLCHDTGCFTLTNFSDTNLFALRNKSVLHCHRCFAWLGICSNVSSVKFWNDTVKFANIPCDQSQEEISKCIFYSLIHKVIVNCLFPICNILMKTELKEEQCLIISILDRHLLVLEYEQELEMKEKVYLKISFRELKNSVSDNDDNIHETITVSKPTYMYVLKSLYSMTEISVGSDKITYLQI